MRYAYIVTDGRMHDIRFVADDYQLAAGEQEGEADVLPQATPVAAPASPTVADIIAVLTPEQQEALQQRVNAATTE